MFVLPFLAALLAVAAPDETPRPTPLPGVEDEETTIPAGRIREFQPGRGDVIFVRHQSGRWYRVALTPGCLKTLRSLDSLVFDRSEPSGRIDRFTRVRQPAFNVSCFVESIRRSAPPPQVDSKSPVTLD